MNDLITVPAQPGELDIMTLGKLLVESHYFQDAGQMAQAVVKVLAGRELGFGPIASMTGIHIVQGRPTLGADLLAKAVKRSGRYNYRVTDLTDATWIHGGTLADIQNVVTVGVPEKGMLTWGPILGPDKIAKVSAFVHSAGGGQ